MHPIFVLIISLFILGLIISNSLTEKVFKKKSFSLAFINVFVWSLAIVFYDKFIVNNNVLYLIAFIYAIIVYVVFGLLLYFSFKSSMLKANHYHMLIESIKSTRFNVYIIMDGKDRIKEISSALLVELGLEYDEVIGKKFFDVFDKAVRFTKFNGVEVNNRYLRDYYKNYKVDIKENQEDKREIVFQNYDGQSIVLNVIEQPVYIFSKFRGRMWIGEKKSDATLLNAERELLEKREELEGIRYKFIAAIELTDEKLFFADLDQRYVWMNDNFKEEFALMGNTLGLDDYRAMIHQEDTYKYMKALDELTKTNPYYSISYRMIQKDHYVWVKEKGKRLFEDESASIILGFIETVKSNQFEKLGIPDLDNALSDIDLLRDVQELYKAHRTFELLAIRVHNLPSINEEYGRSVGNMILGEYIKRIKQNFRTESSQIYRMTGIDFIITITDVRKMEMIKRMFEVERAPLNLTMNYGAIEIVVDARVGIAISSQDAEEAEVLIGCAKQALRFAADDNYMRNCCYYRDVR